MLLTYEMLQAKRGCAVQAHKFRALFPEGVVLTEALCLAHVGDFDFTWGARNLLSDTAWEAYSKARATAREVYEQARAPAREAYCKACAIAFFAGWQADNAP